MLATLGLCLKNPQPLHLAFDPAAAHDFSVRGALFRGPRGCTIGRCNGVWEGILQGPTRGNSYCPRATASQLAAGQEGGLFADSISCSAIAEPQITIGSVLRVRCHILDSNRHNTELEFVVTQTKQRLAQFLIATNRTLLRIGVLRFLSASPASGIAIS
jgi:hypothetical protein